MITRSKSRQLENYEFVSLEPNKKYTPLISASYTRNHIYNYRENDVGDLLRKYNRINYNRPYIYEPINYITLNSYRKKRGLEFEKKIFNCWENSQISIKSFENFRWTEENCKSCKEHIVSKNWEILKHIPIINSYNKVGGIPDILIRSDKIKSILNEDYPFSNDPLHYVILEIKYS